MGVFEIWTFEFGKDVVVVGFCGDVMFEIECIVIVVEY